MIEHWAHMPVVGGTAYASNSKDLHWLWSPWASVAIATATSASDWVCFTVAMAAAALYTEIKQKLQ